MPDNFYTATIAHDPRFHSTAQIRDTALLEPVTRNTVEAIIQGAGALGIELMVTETYRSEERQSLLYNQHATQLKTAGVHHYGLACDFCKLVDGRASWDGDWTFLGRLARAHGCIWGGDWGAPGQHHTFIDADHIQRIAVHDQPGLFSGEWYPDDDYSPQIPVITT